MIQDQFKSSSLLLEPSLSEPSLSKSSFPSGATSFFILCSTFSQLGVVGQSSNSATSSSSRLSSNSLASTLATTSYPDCLAGSRLPPTYSNRHVPMGQSF